MELRWYRRCVRSKHYWSVQVIDAPVELRTVTNQVTDDSNWMGGSSEVTDDNKWMGGSSERIWKCWCYRLFLSKNSDAKKERFYQQSNGLRLRTSRALWRESSRDLWRRRNVFFELYAFIILTSNFVLFCFFVWCRQFCGESAINNST